MRSEDIRLTQYSHGAGCGCKIAPDVLSRILAEADGGAPANAFPSLLVGHQSRDDAAAVILDEDRAVLSTTDFFMPIVDDPYDFGRIAATNAISDIYAMGGTPQLGIAILGWPIDKLAPEIANQVVQGGRDVCAQLGFPLAGGHSIDAPEPIFGLAVTGTVKRAHLKQNDAACADDLLILTNHSGLAFTPQRNRANSRRRMEPRDRTDVSGQSSRRTAELDGVHALTDVTGFGLAGHLMNVSRQTSLPPSARPPSPSYGLDDYIAQAVPGGTQRN